MHFARIASAIVSLATFMAIHGCGSAPLNLKPFPSNTNTAHKIRDDDTPCVSVPYNPDNRHDNAKSDQQLTNDNPSQVEQGKRLTRTMKSLASLATVTLETRGLVILFSGTDLFMPDDSGLMPLAKREMNIVADVLLANPECSVCITAYADTTADESVNLKVSLQQASIVRDYLATRGYRPDLIEIGTRSNDSHTSGSIAARRGTIRDTIEIVVEHWQTSPDDKAALDN